MLASESFKTRLDTWGCANVCVLCLLHYKHQDKKRKVSVVHAHSLKLIMDKDCGKTEAIASLNSKISSSNVPSASPLTSKAMQLPPSSGTPQKWVNTQSILNAMATTNRSNDPTTSTSSTPSLPTTMSSQKSPSATSPKSTSQQELNLMVSVPSSSSPSNPLRKEKSSRMPVQIKPLAEGDAAPQGILALQDPKWPNVFLEGMHQLWLEEYLCDIIITTCDRKELNAHKNVLCK